MNVDKTEILTSVRKFIKKQKSTFTPGETYIMSSGAVWDEDDVSAIVEIALDRWYGGTRYSYEFERHLASFIKQRHVTMCNSGSSANLLAISALMSRQLKGRELKKGDEVITVAAGFPTTVNAIVQNGLVPVFVDVSLPTYNALPHAIEEAISDKTRAIFIAHTLGNPLKTQELRDLADRNELWLVSDCCDALGAEYLNKPLPTFADISTFSFYPAHHISTGEGGAVATDSPLLNKIIHAFRDWGRDCWCLPGKDNTCGKRYGWQLGELPCAFDHKYIFSEIGYNLKATDIQAALGITQMKKLPKFIEARAETWKYYRESFDELKKFFVIPEPTLRSTPSWFGFALTVRDNAPFSRSDIVTFLENNRIGTRMLFAGNLTKQPAYANAHYRVSGALKKTDTIMNNTFWMGVSPVVTPLMREYVVEKMMEFIKSK